MSRSSQTARSSAPSGTAQRRVELVQVPAQPLLAATPLGDQVVTVVDQQLQLAQRLLASTWTVQRRLLQRRPWRPRARRSSRTCPASGRADAAAQSAAAAPAPAAHPPQAASARGRASRAGNPRPPTAAPRRALRPATTSPSTGPLCSATARPSSSTATAVSECLCTSTPITIIQLASKREGATGERTDLNRGQKPRSYQVTLDGLGKAAATQHWQVGKQPTFGNRVSRRQPELSNPPDATTRPRMTLSSGMSLEGPGTGTADGVCGVAHQPLTGSADK